MTICEKKLVPGNSIGSVFDVHSRTFDKLGYKDSRMNACGYSLGATFSPTWMDVPPMIFGGNPLIIKSGMVFFITPTAQFILGFFYFNEPFSDEKLISFILIWFAVFIYLKDLYENN